MGIVRLSHRYGLSSERNLQKIYGRGQFEIEFEVGAAAHSLGLSRKNSYRTPDNRFCIRSSHATGIVCVVSTATFAIDSGRSATRTKLIGIVHQTRLVAMCGEILSAQLRDGIRKTVRRYA